jgi:hypothetical protein
MANGRNGRSLGRPRCCSSLTARRGDARCLTPSRRPKSLAAPSAAIYEMTSRDDGLGNSFSGFARVAYNVEGRQRANLSVSEGPRDSVFPQLSVALWDSCIDGPSFAEVSATSALTLDPSDSLAPACSAPGGPSPSANSFRRFPSDSSPPGKGKIKSIVSLDFFQLRAIVWV